MNVNKVLKQECINIARVSKSLSYR